MRAIMVMSRDHKVIAVLSGKGGTGKTFVSVNLAYSLPDSIYVDCDVEEPNGALFLKPTGISTQAVDVMVPTFNAKQCTGCRACVDFCRFNALSYVGQNVKVFSDICHSCGGCVLVCQEDALTNGTKRVGEVHTGESTGTKVISGMLAIGQPSGVPIIAELNRMIDKQEQWVIKDCPPGASCAVMESLEGVDYCVLVTEPTVFGVHNLAMVKELLDLKRMPYGVVINKVTDDHNPAKTYCNENGIEILSRFSFSQTLAGRNAEGNVAAAENDEIKAQFELLNNRIKKEVNG